MIANNPNNILVADSAFNQLIKGPGVKFPYDFED